MAPDRETSIRRGMDVLLSLASPEAVERGGMGVTRISELLGREKSQVSRALKALSEYGLVERNRDAMTYRLGWRLYALAQIAGRPRVLEEARPVLRALAASTQERVHLSVLEGTTTLTILSESPGRAVEAVGWVGRETPLYCTSAGQALLLDHDEDEIGALLRDVEFVQRAPNTLRDLDGLLRKLERSRAAGAVVSDEEFESGLLAIAAPVRGPGAEIAAVLNLSGPKFRIEPRLDELVAVVRDQASALSRALDAPASDAPAA
jgi:IclR family KDG regulon transcriptional repressor